MKSDSSTILELTEEILRKGSSIRFKATGASMYPFIRDGDIVCAEPIELRNIEYADIVLFRTPAGKMVIHRVIKLKKVNKAIISIVTKGDSSLAPDGEVYPEAILGRVVSVENRTGVLRLDKKIPRFANLLYASLLPLSKWPYLLISVILRRIEKRDGMVVIASPPLFQRRTKQSKNRNCVIGQCEDDSLLAMTASSGGEALQDNRHYISSYKSIMMLEQAKKVISGFDGLNIPTIILKGIFFAEKIYGDIAARLMTDIDILIDKKDLAGADAILCALGYSQPPQYKDFLNNCAPCPVNSIMYFANDRTKPAVHIHWHLINSTWPLDALVEKFDMGRVWQSSGDTEINGIPTRALSPEHLVIYSAYHGLHHSFDKPAMVSDIIELIKFYGNRIDWNIVREECDRSGLKFIVYAALKHAMTVSGSDISEIEKVRPKYFGAIDRAVLKSVKDGRSSYKISYFAFLSAQKGAWGKLVFLFRTIFPSRIVMSHNLRIPASQVRVRHYLSRMACSR